MKKVISFLIIFIPWNVSLFIIYFTNLYFNSLVFIIISIIFYLLITKYIFYIIKNDLANNDFMYKLSLFYILNQSFNLCLFYYKFLFLSIILLISKLVILCKLKKFKNT